MLANVSTGRVAVTELLGGVDDPNWEWLMNNVNTQGNSVFVLVESGLIFFSTYLAYVYLSHPSTLNPFGYGLDFYFNFAALLVPYLLGSLSVGLYNSKLRETFGSVVRRIFFAIAITYFFIGIVAYNLAPNMQPDRDFLPMVFFAIFVMVAAFRYVVQDDHTLGVNKKKIVVIGAGERASILEKRMRRKVDQKGFELIGYIPMSGDTVNDNIPTDRRLDVDVKTLVDFVDENCIDSIVIACDERRNVLPIESLFDCKIRGVEILDILDFLERETGQIAVNLIYPSWVIYSNGFESDNYVRVTLDYVFNAIMATIVLIFTWPFMLITALLIYIDDGYKKGASILYTQERVGMGGGAFKIYKFRSMRPDAEVDGVKWAQKRDKRTTRIGAFIRKYRIDELPQLINVYRGEMGFVGPRPERPEFVKELVKNIPYYNQRHNVKPGLTGWAQLKYPYGSSMEDSLEKLKYDLYYIKHRGMLLDLFILIRTVEIIIFGKGR